MDKQAIICSCLILTISLLLTPASSNPLLRMCLKKRISNNTALERNLDKLLKNLTSQTVSSNGFFSSSAGVDSNKVNAQALCRGDANATVCQKCLDSAIREIRKCGTSEATMWHEYCQVHYASREFFSMMDYGGQVPEKRYYSRRNVSRRTEFGKGLTRLIDELLKDDEISNPDIMFATRDIRYYEDRRIYGLAQCTRDIDASKCRTCLRSAWGELMQRSSFREGGIMLSRSCNVRFEVYLFYNNSSLKVKSEHTWSKWKVVLVASCASTALVILICSFFVCLLWKNGSTQDESKLLHSTPSPLATMISSVHSDLTTNTDELPLMDLSILLAATNDFSDFNKLGQGGFGTVYKGVLTDGKEVAVKRLSRTSWQGLDEFKNELVLIAKLQHRNLVRLMGCAMEGEEKLLVYEFMPNKSLDSFIFEKRSLLDWKTRYNIICGIARGLLYLHEDSRLKIVHRDLKPSNVLLDDEMVAKISDFGLARIFCDDQTTGCTRKVVGTYGYMAPEYAMEGQFSVKSDVFSFGVILLEIISGRKNNDVENSPTLIRHAWQLWRQEREVEFVDPSMGEISPIGEVIRCIQIGLLCVQADPIERPTMSSVVVQLESGLVSLPKPCRPALSPRLAFTNNSQSGFTASITISSP